MLQHQGNDFTIRADSLPLIFEQAIATLIFLEFKNNKKAYSIINLIDEGLSRPLDQFYEYLQNGLLDMWFKMYEEVLSWRHMYELDLLVFSNHDEYNKLLTFVGKDISDVLQMFNDVFKEYEYNRYRFLKISHPYLTELVQNNYVHKDMIKAHQNYLKTLFEPLTNVYGKDEFNKQKQRQKVLFNKLCISRGLSPNYWKGVYRRRNDFLLEFASGFLIDDGASGDKKYVSISDCIKEIKPNVQNDISLKYVLHYWLALRFNHMLDMHGKSTKYGGNYDPKIYPATTDYNTQFETLHDSTPKHFVNSYVIDSLDRKSKHTVPLLSIPNSIVDRIKYKLFKS